MKILLAKDAGYCFGVRDAVKLAYDTADKDG
jgi:4-hydroxy-3-methylbut-2-enyl diphosphate reductase IspH